MLGKLRKLLAPAPDQGSQRYRKVMSFDDAATLAGAGYMDETILDVTGADDTTPPSLFDLPDFFGPFFTALSIAALDKPGGPLRVLDFGGAVGDYCDYANLAFCSRVEFDWHVVETEMYARKGRTLGRSVSFHASIDDFDNTPDVAVFSGSLQYVRDWKAALTHHKTLGARTIYIARTPVGPIYQPYLQTVYYGDKSVTYPGAILPDRDICDALSSTHDLFASWALEHQLGDFGIVKAPAMIWRKRGQ